MSQKKKKYEFQLVNLTGELRPILREQLGYLRFCLPENSYSLVAPLPIRDFEKFSLAKIIQVDHIRCVKYVNVNVEH